MKIGNIQEKPATAPAPAPAPTGKAAANETSAAALASATSAEASAKVELSSAAASLMASTGSPEFDTAKVARITQAIADGSFKIDPEVIADKLIANAQELLSKGSR